VSDEHLVVFKSSMRPDEHVDLELTKQVSAGGYSWWKLDGYETWDEDDEEMPVGDGEDEDDEDDEDVN
jgi:hypothetical protein